MPLLQRSTQLLKRGVLMRVEMSSQYCCLLVANIHSVSVSPENVCVRIVSFWLRVSFCYEGYPVPVTVLSAVVADFQKRNNKHTPAVTTHHVWSSTFSTRNSNPATDHIKLKPTRTPPLYRVPFHPFPSSSIRIACMRFCFCDGSFCDRLRKAGQRTNTLTHIAYVVLDMYG